MSGPHFSATLTTGAKQALADSAFTIQTTLDNPFLIEAAGLFIGLAVVLCFVCWVALRRASPRVGAPGVRRIPIDSAHILPPTGIPESQFWAHIAESRPPRWEGAGPLEGTWEGGKFRISDGRHRLGAAVRAGAHDIDVWA